MNFDRTFRQLGYQVEVHKDRTAAQVKSTVIEKISQYSENYDSIVLCFSTHGESNNYIFGSDSISFNVYELVID